MSSWRSTKTGNHFRLSNNRPGLNLRDFNSGPVSNQSPIHVQHDSHIKSMLYEEKQKAKVDRAKELAQKHHDKSSQHHRSQEELMDQIPFGQPIMVGHHSEGKHRSNIRRQDNHMRKAIEHDSTAEYFENKAGNIANPYAVNSDDPDAVIKLKNRIEKFEKEKAVWNEKLKTADPNTNQFADNNPRMIRMHMSSVTTKIRNTKKRIDTLNTAAKISTPDIRGGKTRNGVTMKVNHDDNRIQLKFGGVPSQPIRDKLKSRGWRWTPSKGVWQRGISAQSEYLANEIMDMSD